MACCSDDTDSRVLDRGGLGWDTKCAGLERELAGDDGESTTNGTEDEGSAV